MIAGPATRLLAAFLTLATLLGPAPEAEAWSDYQIIIWPERTPAQYAALKAMGVTAGMVRASRDGVPRLDAEQIERLRAHGLRFYLENIAADFYSPYHRWFPNRPVNALFLDAKKRHRADPNDRSVFVREPSLSDPAWLERIRARLEATVRLYAPYQPLFYNLADEAGIADVSAAWDFDLSPHSLAGMRAWLREQYGTLDSLNREWGSDFPDWDAVTPTITTEAMRRADENYAPWADFKAWMDVVLARAVRAGTDGAHAGDPSALAGLEGAQIPGWGGYDYTQLVHAVDLMEIYDLGGNVEIARSLNPAMPILTTSMAGAGEVPTLWREALRGTRGLILWDDNNSIVEPDGALGSRGLALEPSFAALRRGLGALLINSERVLDPVAILYSPASLRTQWMLDHRGEGDGWTRRSASSENKDNAIRRSTAFFARSLKQMGVQPRFISSAMLGEGALRTGGIRLLILPQAISLSGSEAAEIRAFAAGGGVVLAEGDLGLFDEHSRKLARPLLPDLFPGGGARSLRSDSPARLEALREALGRAGIAPGFRVSGGNAEIHVFRNGPATIIGASLDPGEAGPEAQPLALDFVRPVFVYDLRDRRALGRMQRISLPFDNSGALVLSISESPLQPPVILPPAQAQRGKVLELALRVEDQAGPGVPVLHVELTDESGEAVPNGAANLRLPGGAGLWPLPIAEDARPGRWTIRVMDPRSAQTTVATLPVTAGD